MQEERDPELEQYFVSAALITSGLTSFVQVARFSVRAPKFFSAGRLFLGTGMISLMGVCTHSWHANCALCDMLALAQPGLRCTR